MAGQRMLHPAQSMSQRVSALSDFEYRVWEQTKLSSDDFGVLLFDATAVRAENSRLRKAPERQVKEALAAMATAGLLLRFDHQGEVYACAPVWQTWQQIRFPRKTSRPKPTEAVLALCDAATQHLFSIHPGGCQLPTKKKAKDSEVTSKSLQSDFEESAQSSVVVAPEPPANANASANANADPVLVLSEGGPGETAPRRASRQSVTDRAAALGIVQPGSWQRQHASHALRADLCDWVCLPEAVHAECVKRLTGAGTPLTDALAAVLAWALDVRARWQASGEIPGDDNFVFWRNEWQRTHGSNRVSSAPKPGAGLDALIAGGGGRG